MYTDLDAIAKIVAKGRKYFLTEKTKCIEWRIGQIKGVQRFLTAEKDGIIKCLKADLNQTDFLAELGEINVIWSATERALKNIKKWAGPRATERLSLLSFPASANIIFEPLGVCVIFGVWNFPFVTVMEPLVSALAAGNCVILKPSEISASASDFIASKLSYYVDKEAVQIITGGAEQSTELLKQRLDHIFYTGSPAIGKIVMAAAAKNLTPVTLELGGKNPVFVCDSADLNLAAKRIAWGKSQNMGQACVAPDYVLISAKNAQTFCRAISEQFTQFFGRDMSLSKDLSRIATRRHFDRLKTLLGRETGAIVFGGRTDAATLFFEPTVVLSQNGDSPFMDAEIFGPVLVVVPTQSLEHSLALSRRFEKPLALYVFSRSEAETRRVVAATSSGAVLVNDVLLHAGEQSLPFGGVGHSGTGRCHGRWGFEAFSNERAVMRRGAWPDPALRYPPYSARGLRAAKALVALGALCSADLAWALAGLAAGALVWGRWVWAG